MQQIILRKAEPCDLAALQEISRTTFTETFGEQNTEDNMKRYLEHNLGEESLRNELLHPFSAFYFAELENKPIGYLKINTKDAQTEKMQGKAMEIERIYVLKQYHGNKAGQILFEKAVTAAEDQNADFLWLGVWEKNHRAISFYKKNGFVEFDKHIFKLGEDEQTDIMMRLDLHD